MDRDVCSPSVLRDRKAHGVVFYHLRLILLFSLHNRLQCGPGGALFYVSARDGGDWVGGYADSV